MKAIFNQTLCVLGCLITLCNFSFAQNQKGDLRLPHHSSYQLYVVFNDDFDLSETSDLNTSIPELATIAEQYGLQFKTGIQLSKERKKALDKHKTANRNEKSRYSKLSNIYIVKTKTSNPEQLLLIAQQLESLPAVKYCHLTSIKPIEPPVFNSDDIPPTTDNFVSNQNYIQANPGVDMQYAWDRGVTGSGISIRDIEYGFNKNHEEFAKTNAKIATNMTINSLLPASYQEHGTAVAGIVYAGNNGFGVTGLAYGSNQYVVYPEYTEEKQYDRIYAVTRAIEEAQKGDIIIYEMQASGETETTYVMAEFDKIVWELTQSATAAGVTVVAAAGNGNANIDSDFYKEYLSRGDSGAIIVGGGSPDTSHNKTSSSTYGSRVNLQGWGEKVWTTSEFNQCTIIRFGDDINQAYTSCFRGTSSATPIVASCAAVLQSYYFSQTQTYLTPQQIRDILVSTGIAQGTGGKIGPLPNMKAAMQKVDTEYLLSRPSTSLDATFLVFPNPANDVVTVTLPEYFSANTVLEIYNLMGQLVGTQSIIQGSNVISLNNLQSGTYILKVSDATYSAVKRVFKK